MSVATHYDTLGVAHAADPAVVRAAYKALIQIHHPDRHTGEAASQAHARTLAINAAFAVLADPIQRAAYDRQLRQEAPATPAADDAKAHADAMAQVQAAHREAARRRQAAAAWAQAATPPPDSKPNSVHTLVNPTDRTLLVQWLGQGNQVLATRHLMPGQQVQVPLRERAVALQVAYDPVSEGSGRYAVAQWQRVPFQGQGVTLPPPPGLIEPEVMSWKEAWASLGRWGWGAVPVALTGGLLGAWLI